jgi:hypothetical protein
MLADPVDPEPVLRDSSDDYMLALARSGELTKGSAMDAVYEHSIPNPPFVRPSYGVAVTRGGYRGTYCGV